MFKRTDPQRKLSKADLAHMVSSNLFNRSWWSYQWRYLRNQTPWAVDETPKELLDLMRHLPPGRALDLGCGTGTCSLALAARGWHVTGIDFSRKAVRIARGKARDHRYRIDFIHGDVTRPVCAKGGYDLVLDIGCLFSLPADQHQNYADNLAASLKPGGRYLLHAWLPYRVKGKPRGIAPESLNRLLGDRFARTDIGMGEEKGRGYAWYWYRRK